MIKLLEQREVLKRGKVANFINRSLRVWLQPMLSLLDEGDSVEDDLVDFSKHDEDPIIE